MGDLLIGVAVVLLDIEGTICPISFVKDTLFPYALEALPGVLQQEWDTPDFRPYREAFPDEFKISPESLQAHVEDLTTRDVKIAYLKNLQGYLWQSGYSSHAYATPLFPDVVPNLRDWLAAPKSKSIAIYSSGSVAAQKLLFAHVKTDVATNPDPCHVDPLSVEDLTRMVTDWFDTVNAGPKTEASSYTKIARQLNVEAGNVLFLSDNTSEVAAALDAGVKAIVVDRPGNKDLSEHERKMFRVVESLDEVEPSR